MATEKPSLSTRFAHLLGISAARAEESDEDRKKREDEEAKAADEERKEGETDEEYEKRTGKKAKKAEGDDDEADAEEDEKKEKAVRANERARCAAIFACAEAGTRPDMAAHLAFQTDMSAQAAVEMLRVSAAGAPRKTALAERMAQEQAPNVGSEGGEAAADANSAKAIAARIIASAAAVRGEKV